MPSSNSTVIDKNRDYYAILNIPFHDNPSALVAGGSRPPVISKHQLRNAYHKALLKHHPDKAGGSVNGSAGGIKSGLSVPIVSSSQSPSSATVVFTIDDITNAYRILSDPVLRAEYDREILLRRRNVDDNNNRHPVGAVSFHTGLEVVDLEDMLFEDRDADDNVGMAAEGQSSDYWHRSCRCGDEKGFIVTEDELDAEAQNGEILVGCRGCSLWMKVLFAVADGDDGGHDDAYKEALG